MQCVSMHVLAVKSTQSVSFTAVLLADIGIVCATELLEALNDIFLADLKGDAGTAHQLVDSLAEVSDHTAVQLHEIFGLRPVQKVALHRADLEALVEDPLDDLSCEALRHSMRLD